MNDIVMEKFAPEEQAIIAQLDLARLPRHVAFIMDGNGRWATQQGLPRVIGHHAGVESIRSIIRAAQDLGIGILTLYSFSTENWSRPDSEIHALMTLIEQQLRQELEGMHEEGVRVRHIGRTEGLPASLCDILRDSAEKTRDNPGLTVVFAINYSGRSELLDAARALAARAVAGDIDARAITEADMRQALYAPDLPDPDLLIRTGGEQRVSNYLLWQIAYSEFWYTPLLWPEFRAMHLLHAIAEYQQRKRKFGGITS